MPNPLTPIAVYLGTLDITQRNTAFIVKVDMALTRATRGRVPLLRLVSLGELTLQVPGRKSGLPRTVPLLTKAWRNGFVIVGSNWGQPKMPDWVHNLRAAGPGDVIVHSRGAAIEMDARELEGDLREEAFAAARAQWPNYDIYARRSDRVLPVFHLTPRL